MEWSLDQGKNHHGGEAAMDNSPRFDQAVPFDAVAFSVYLALEMRYIAGIARELGQVESGRHWDHRSSTISA